jgi:hypothetical protein
MEASRAADLIAEEATRTRQPPNTSDITSPAGLGATITDADIQVLKRKHAFLADFSDFFIRSTPIGDLMRIESPAMKACELERSKDTDDLLARNKANLAHVFVNVPEGRDNRWNTLDDARLLCC